MPKCTTCPRIAYYGLEGEEPRYCRDHRKAGTINLFHRLCDYEGCDSTSRAFGFPGQKGTHCKKHVQPGMINVVNPRCEHPDCESTSIAFDFPGGKGRFCKEHALSTMVNIRNRRCEHPECYSKSRNFDVPGGKGRFCKEHKREGMIDVLTQRCIHPGCSIRANYSVKGTPPRYCSEHRIPGMCNRQACEYEGCTTISSYNYSGETSGRFCAAHKLDGMTRVRGWCQHSGCKKTASFGTTTPRFCKAHAEDGMRNLIAKYCEHPGCTVQATYNNAGEKARFCQTHSTNEMVCVQKPKGCQYPDCTCRSHHYDVPGGGGRFCAKHKQSGMVDVMNPKCDATGCTTLATYGIPGAKPSRCSPHRSPGMISRPRARCVVCRKPAVYGKAFVPSHCDLHKESDDENLMERECVSCHLIMVLDKNNKCEYCDPRRFESNRLAKQNALMEYLNRKGLRGNSTDVIIDRGACGRERPDRTFDFDDKVVVLECDEHQHRERACDCEQTRMVNIAQSYGGIPVYFIRWNPDNYTSGKKPDPIAKRHSTIARFIQDIRDGAIELPHTLLSVFYMYYDGWEGFETSHWHTLLEFDN